MTNQPEQPDQQSKDKAANGPDTVDPSDLVYNEGTVENPEEVLSRPNVAPQPQADNERAM